MTQAREVGFIGLGEMGGRMAQLLLSRGRRLFVHDTRPEAMERLAQLGAQPCGSPASIADRAPTVMLSLPTPEVVRTVATGARGVIEGSAVRTCVDLSTTGPAVAREIAGELAARGIEHIDAPVSGGVRGAEQGTLTVMVASSPTALAGVRELLDELAGHVFHVGPEPGMGQLAKVLNNLLSATALAATAEALALGVKRGLDAQMLLDVLNASSGRNSATAQKFPEAVLPRTFDFGFALALMNKDVQICLAEARRAGVPMALGTAVAAEWELASRELAEGADCTEIVKLVEQRAGAEISASGVEPT